MQPAGRETLGGSSTPGTATAPGSGGGMQPDASPPPRARCAYLGEGIGTMQLAQLQLQVAIAHLHFHFHFCVCDCKLRSASLPLVCICCPAPALCAGGRGGRPSARARAPCSQTEVEKEAAWSRAHAAFRVSRRWCCQRPMVLTAARPHGVVHGGPSHALPVPLEPTGEGDSCIDTQTQLWHSCNFKLKCHSGSGTDTAVVTLPRCHVVGPLCDGTLLL